MSEALLVVLVDDLMCGKISFHTYYLDDLDFRPVNLLDLQAQLSHFLSAMIFFICQFEYK